MYHRAILFLISLICLTSCKPEQWTFAGETENWRVIYEVAMEKKQTSSVLRIEYIGKKPAPKQIGYRIDTPDGPFIGEGVLNEQGVLIIVGDVCQGCAEMNEEMEWNVAVEWGRQMEMFTLHFEEK